MVTDFPHNSAGITDSHNICGNILCNNASCTDNRVIPYCHTGKNYYTCTKQILRGLGQMYIAGDSMTDNINAAGGDGTAEFAHRAIEIYCK